MKHIPTFEAFTKKEHSIDEGVTNRNVFTVKYYAESEKDRHERVAKMQKAGEAGCKVLFNILERLFPGKYEEEVGYSEIGNAAFCLANTKEILWKSNIQWSDIEDDPEFKKHFDLAGANLDDYSSKAFNSYFRLKV